MQKTNYKKKIQILQDILETNQRLQKQDLLYEMNHLSFLEDVSTNLKNIVKRFRAIRHSSIKDYFFSKFSHIGSSQSVCNRSQGTSLSVRRGSQMTNQSKIFQTYQNLRKARKRPPQSKKAKSRTNFKSNTLKIDSSRSCLFEQFSSIKGFIRSSKAATKAKSKHKKNSFCHRRPKVSSPAKKFTSHKRSRNGFVPRLKNVYESIPNKENKRVSLNQFSEKLLAKPPLKNPNNSIDFSEDEDGFKAVNNNISRFDDFINGSFSGADGMRNSHEILDNDSFENDFESKAYMGFNLLDLSSRQDRQERSNPFKMAILDTSSLQSQEGLKEQLEALDSSRKHYSRTSRMRKGNELIRNSLISINKLKARIDSNLRQINNLDHELDKGASGDRVSSLPKKELPDYAFRTQRARNMLKIEQNQPGDLISIKTEKSGYTTDSLGIPVQHNKKPSQRGDLNAKINQVKFRYGKTDRFSFISNPSKRAEKKKKKYKQAKKLTKLSKVDRGEHFLGSVAGSVNWKKRSGVKKIRVGKGEERAKGAETGRARTGWRKGYASMEVYKSLGNELKARVPFKSVMCKLKERKKLLDRVTAEIAKLDDSVMVNKSED